MDKPFIFNDIKGFLQKHRVLVASAVACGVGFILLKKHFEGGKCKSLARLDGKTVIITGSNTGIGRETALDLAGRGARVILACRDITKAERAAQVIIKETQNPNVEVKCLDLASLESVRKFAEQVNKKEEKLDILINNAGIMMCPRWETEDGNELQFGVNHLGHFLLTNLLLELIKKSAPSRIINVSSLAHVRGKMNLDNINSKYSYDPVKAYQQSKLANVLFTKELSRRLQGTNVTVNALHPGVVKTELTRYLPQSMPFYVRWLFIPFRPFLKTPKQGAQTSIYCAVAEELEGVTGKYFSDCAVKDPAPHANDTEAAKKLWSLSAEMVGLKDV